MTRPPLIPPQDPLVELLVLMLEVVDRCNCRCVMCDLWRRREGLEMSVADVERWAPDWRRFGVTRVGLTGGEPLMHSRLGELLETLGSSGFSLTLMTTGVLLKRHCVAVARWCDSVVVSLDGPAEVHDEIRNVKGAFAKIEAGVAALRRQQAGVRITARCTVQRRNMAHLQAAADAARHIGLDGISFLPADTDSDAFAHPEADPSQRTRSLQPGPAGLAILRDQIEALSESSDGFVAENGEALRRRVLGHMRAQTGLEKHQARPCNAPWVSAVVTVDGAVRPCFFLPAYGSMDDSRGLSAVVNSTAARSFRTRLDVRSDFACRRCVCPLALRKGEDPR